MKNHRSLKIIILIFTITFISVVIYLFSPVLECAHNFGDYAEDCDDAFSLLLVPLAMFFIAWIIIFIIALFIASSKAGGT